MKSQYFALLNAPCMHDIDDSVSILNYMHARNMHSMATKQEATIATCKVDLPRIKSHFYFKLTKLSCTLVAYMCFAINGVHMFRPLVEMLKCRMGRCYCFLVMSI